jgi:cobalt/nickel transport protein
MRSVIGKLMIGLVILVILVPLGFIVPRFFNAGEAWGEWGTETLEKLVGYLPAGLKWTAHLWRAPVPGYGLGPETASTAAKSAHYVLSSLIGAALVVCIMYVLSKILVRKK